VLKTYQMQLRKLILIVICSHSVLALSQQLESDQFKIDVVLGRTRFQMQLDRDGFAEGKPVVFSESLNRVSFTIENRTHNQHETTLMLKGLLPGSYSLLFAGKPVSKWIIEGEEEKNVKIPVPPLDGAVVIINRN
jgi:uncharacterized membrane protein